MAKSMNDPSTSEESEVNPEFEELLEAFNEIHEEAQRLVVLNKKLKNDFKLHITKFASTQVELNNLKQENEKLDLCPMDHNYEKKVFCFGSTGNFI